MLNLDFAALILLASTAQRWCCDDTEVERCWEHRREIRAVSGSEQMKIFWTHSKKQTDMKKSVSAVESGNLAVGLRFFCVTWCGRLSEDICAESAACNTWPCAGKKNVLQNRNCCFSFPCSEIIDTKHVLFFCRPKHEENHFEHLKPKHEIMMIRDHDYYHLAIKLLTIN